MYSWKKSNGLYKNNKLIFLYVLFLISILNVSYASEEQPTYILYEDGSIKSDHCLERPTVDSSVELELDIDPILKVLTTMDGKVGSLFEHVRNLDTGVFGVVPYPQELIDWAKKNSIEDIANYEWDKLPEDIKMIALKEVSKGRGGNNFFRSRKIPNMKVKNKLLLHFNKDTMFAGKVMKKGDTEVDVTEIVSKNPVEYRGPTDVEDVLGVELHFREAQPSGVVHEDAWKFLDGLNVCRNHQHIHIVAPIPYDEFKDKKDNQAFLMADYFRRTNLFSELLSIASGDSISDSVSEGATYFASLTPAIVKGVADYFLHYARGEEIPEIGDDFKMGWVGMRGKDKYDGDIDLWGMEYRDISASPETDNMREVLNAIQWGMNKNDFGISSSDFDKWKAAFENGIIKKGNDVEISQKLSDIWYNQDVDTLLSESHAEIKDKLNNSFGILGKRKLKLLKKVIKSHTEVKMLLHNWDNDPIFFSSQFKFMNKEQVLKEIKDAQKKALEKIFKNKEEVIDIMKDFSIDSNLMFIMAKSLGLKMHPGAASLYKTLNHRDYDTKMMKEFLNSFELLTDRDKTGLLAHTVLVGDEKMALKIIKTIEKYNKDSKFIFSSSGNTSSSSTQKERTLTIAEMAKEKKMKELLKLL
ncbi:MAG: hypothetical protein HQK51_04155 [Oligoflexia bacterium]|nr:hypothetical protein [Oligoflexia bacterium]